MTSPACFPIIAQISAGDQLVGRPPVPAGAPGPVATGGGRLDLEAIIEAMFPGLLREDAPGACARRLP